MQTLGWSAEEEAIEIHSCKIQKKLILVLKLNMNNYYRLIPIDLHFLINQKELKAFINIVTSPALQDLVFDLVINTSKTL